MRLVWALGVLGFLLPTGSFAAVASESSAKVDAEDSYESSEPLAAVEFGFYAPYLPNYDVLVADSTRPTGQGFRLGLQWLPLSGQIGKLSIGAGISYGKIPGLVNSPFVELYPLDLGVTYRVDVLENQFVVPYFSFGLNPTLVRPQFSPGMKLFQGIEYGGGLAFCLDFIDRGSAISLDQSVGIKNTFIVVDYRRVDFMTAPTPGEPDLRRNEVRVSLRMEI